MRILYMVPFHPVLNAQLSYSDTLSVNLPIFAWQHNGQVFSGSSSTEADILLQAIMFQRQP